MQRRRAPCGMRGSLLPQGHTLHGPGRGRAARNTVLGGTCAHPHTEEELPPRRCTPQCHQKQSEATELDPRTRSTSAWLQWCWCGRAASAPPPHLHFHHRRAPPLPAPPSPTCCSNYPGCPAEDPRARHYTSPTASPPQHTTDMSLTSEARQRAVAVAER